MFLIFLAAGTYDFLELQVGEISRNRITVNIFSAHGSINARLRVLAKLTVFLLVEECYYDLFHTKKKILFINWNFALGITIFKIGPQYDFQRNCMRTIP